MSPILPRLAASRIHLLARVFPVTVLTGARQTGKSTLVQQPAVVGDREYLTLDDPAVLDQAVHAPDQLVARAERLVLDEVQRVPELLLTLKRAVDQRRVRGRYILTGSANLLLMRQVTESLAGRAGYVTLWPLTRREQLGFGSAGVWSELLATEPGAWRDLLAAQVAPEEPWDDVASRGGYPVPAYELIDERERRAWFEGYAVTYLERDVRRLSAIEQVVELRRLMKALALRIGNLVNQAELARDVNLSPSTVQRYVQLLETSYQLVRIPSYVLNRTKRPIKAPKFYWSDTGLAMYLSGEAAPRGAHLENVVALDLLTWAQQQDSRTEILYWRTAKGAEVDFVVETPGRVLPIEVKAGASVSTSDARSLMTFLEEYQDLAPAGLLLHTGSTTFWLTARVLAAPWWKVV